MNDFLAETMRRAEHELRTACDEAAASRGTPQNRMAWKRIDVARRIADAALLAGNLWPLNEAYLDNEAVLRLLRAAIGPTEI